MRTESFQCDGPGCSEVKRATNHWWRMYVLERDGDDQFAGVVVTAWKVDSLSQMFGQVIPFPPEEDHHLCGEQCVSRKLSELMAKDKAQAMEHEKAENSEVQYDDEIKK